MTKAEEMKVLEQIEKLIEKAGEDSYIGMAFAGCVRDAKENIENDFANSMYDRWQTAEQKYEKVKAEADDYKGAYETLNNRTSNLKEKHNEECEALKGQISQLRQDKFELQKDRNIWIEKSNAAETKAEALELENMKLKARLYDLMMAEGK